MRTTQKTKRKLLDSWKSTHCVDCMEQFPSYCMDFDHVPGVEKSFELGSGIHKTLDELHAERAKCVVVCANCHRIRSKERMSFSEPSSLAAARARRHYLKNKEILDGLRSVPCADCARLYPSCCMDFDHLYDKKFSVMRNVRRALHSLLEEVKKCEVVCANCHRKRTLEHT